MSPVTFVQGQRWLQDLDDVAAINVICQALQHRLDIIPTVVEFCAAIISPGMSMANVLPDASDSGRFTGIIKSFNDSKGYGFIFCQEVMDAHGSDVFLHQNQRMDLPVGSAVVFDVKLNPKGEPQALGLEPTDPNSVRLPAGEPSFTRPEQGHGGRPGGGFPGQGHGGHSFKAPGGGVPGQGHGGPSFTPPGGVPQGGNARKRQWSPKRDWVPRVSKPADEQEDLGENNGTIKSFSEQNGFGFIECLDLRCQGLNDVFLHHSQLDGFSVGDQVVFSTYLNSKGQPQAKELRPFDVDDDLPLPVAKKLRFSKVQS